MISNLNNNIHILIEMYINHWLSNDCFQHKEKLKIQYIDHCQYENNMVKVKLENKAPVALSMLMVLA